MFFNECSIGSTYFVKSAVIGMVIFLLCYFFRWRKQKIHVAKGFIYYIFLVYLVGIGFITGLIGIGWGVGVSSYNLVPFVHEDSLLILLNAFLFLPFGILLPLVYSDRKWRWYEILYTGAAISVVIELIQCLFAGRLGDIDDVIMNTAGCLVGYVLYKVVSPFIIKAFHGREFGWGSISWILFLFVLIAALPLKAGRICLGDSVCGPFVTPAGLFSGNTEYAMNFSGIHYTMLYLLPLSVMGWLFARRHPEDAGAKSGKILSVLMIIGLAIMAVMYI